jgi:hypothetical protein
VKKSILHVKLRDSPPMNRFRRNKSEWWSYEQQKQMSPHSHTHIVVENHKQQDATYSTQ